MKTLRDLLLLGDPRLYEVCELVAESELPLVAGWIADLHSVMEEVREKYGFGRGIAAPQLGIMKRLFYLNIDRPMVIINPVLTELSAATFTLWDDCMSFPDLLVRVKRHQALKMTFRNEHWELCEWRAEGAISELIQHEYDHLDGVLCTMRATDNQSFKWKI